MESIDWASRRPRRPQVMSTGGMVAAGHYLATAAGLQVLAAGGNAVDAGVATGMVLNTVHNDMCTFSGVAPIILYLARERRIVTIAGIGTWPAEASAELYRERWGKIPDWPLNCVVPGAADAWLTALKKYGTMTLAQVSRYAIEVAERGHALYPLQQYALYHYLPTYQKWPENRRIFLRDGQVPPVGTVIRQPELAASFRRLVEAEERAAAGGREAGIQAARDLFYRGDMARAMVDYCRQHGGFISEQDFAGYEAQEGPPYSVRFGDLEVFGCGPWCQGSVLLQCLGILANFDLRSMGHNTAPYLHVVAEAIKLAFADRERYCGDPNFVSVPMEGLLSPQYLRARAGLIDMGQAWPGMPPAGDPYRGLAVLGDGASSSAAPTLEPLDTSKPTADTSCLTVADAEGNLFSATPSDGYSLGGIVPGLGLHVSERGGQLHLESEHPNYLAPGKRPSLTPNPFVLFKGGQPFMALATPGNNRQPQAMLQSLLNLAVFGMPPQAAVEAPRVASFSFPGTSRPHVYYPRRLYVEQSISDEVAASLEGLGHEVMRWEDWCRTAGGVCMSIRDPETGVFLGAADPRREGMALGL